MVGRRGIDCEEQLDCAAADPEQQALRCLYLTPEVLTGYIGREVQKVTVIEPAEELTILGLAVLKGAVAVDYIRRDSLVLAVHASQLPLDVLLLIVVATLGKAPLWVAFFEAGGAVTLHKLQVVHAEDHLPDDFHMPLHNGGVLPVVKHREWGASLPGCLASVKEGLRVKEVAGE